MLSFLHFLKNPGKEGTPILDNQAPAICLTCWMITLKSDEPTHPTKFVAKRGEQAHQVTGSFSKMLAATRDSFIGLAKS